MKIAVLGSRGYLGSYISNRLISKKYDVLPITREDLDLTNYSAVVNWLTQNRPNIIINCAIAGRNNLTDISYSAIQNNLGIFLNFFNNSQYFDRFINIGSGAEFDMITDIDHANENDILKITPAESYAYSKNIISRLVLEKDNFYTIRLFGCFDFSEPSNRLLKKISSNDFVEINDRQFDYVSASDLFHLLEFYLNNDNLIKDINCVYPKKILLSELIEKFISIHNIKRNFNISSTLGKTYTGSSTNLESLNLNLEGLDIGLKFYLQKK